jgi:membrane protease YdiL (CAAX protease family)
MSFFTAILRPSSMELAVLAEVVFLAYILVSFIRVIAYTVAQVRAGQMIDGANSPLRLTPPRLAGWLFALCVMVLLFSQSVLYLVLVVVGLSAFLVEARRTASEQFGLTRMRLGKLVKWSLLICGAVIFVELPLGQVVDLMMNAIHLPHPEQETVEVFRRYNQPGQIFLFLVQAVVLSPLIEELFFRGFLLTFLKNYTSTVLAIILSAGVFAFAHANLGSALQLWVLGIVLGVAYEHTGSLLLPIGIHACWNLLTALSLLLERGTS